MNLKYLWIFLIGWTFVSCKSKSVKLASDENLSVSELIQLAQELPTPFVVQDSLLNHKESDSSRIQTTVFKGFLPDSVFQQFYTGKKTLKLFLIGKFSDGETGTYLLIKSVKSANKEAHIFYFTSKGNYLGGMKIADTKGKSGIKRSCKIDSRFNISLIEEWKDSKNEWINRETLYYMDAAGKMILAMTNSNEDLSDEIRGNPIDTLPRKHKYAGDYMTDKKNLVSVRDGLTPNTFRFFIHFSKKEGSCVGEVSGTGEWLKGNEAVFRDADSPCVLYFTFSGGSVTLREDTGCGAYRGIACFFEGSYKKIKLQVKKNNTPTKKSGRK